MLPFFGARGDNFSVLAWILTFPGTSPDSTVFPVLSPILPVSGLDSDSTIFRYSSGQFFGTDTDSTFSRYSPAFYQFPVLTLILLFFGTRSDSFSVPARILPFSGLARILSFSGTDPDSTIFR